MPAKNCLLIGCGSKFGLELLEYLVEDGYNVHSISGSKLEYANVNHLQIDWKTLNAAQIEKFLKELTTVIKEQGDFNEFIKKTEAPGGSYDLEFVIKKGFQKYSTYASDIVEKLLLTDTIQTYIETNKLSKMDIQFIGDALFIEITDEKFRKKALQNRNKFYPEMEEDFWGNTHKVSS